MKEIKDLVCDKNERRIFLKTFLIVRYYKEVDKDLALES